LRSFFSIPFEYDFFLIATELKISLFLWTFLGIAAISIEVMGNFVTFYWEPHLASIVILVMNVCHMIVSIVPLYFTAKSSNYFFNSTLQASPLFTIGELDDDENDVLPPCEIYKLFMYQEAKSAIYDLARRSYCPEIPIFLEANYKYRFSNDMTPDQNFKAFVSIMRKFVLEGSVHQINFSTAKVRLLTRSCRNKNMFLSLSYSEQKHILQDLVQDVEQALYIKFSHELKQVYRQLIGKARSAVA